MVVGGKAPRWGRVLVAVLLAAAVVGVSALRCPAQKAGEAAVPPSVVTFVDGGTVEEKGTPAAAPEPFDLPYLPPDAMGVVCFRPSAVLGRPDMKKYADKVDKAIAAGCKALRAVAGLRSSRRGDRPDVVTFTLTPTRTTKGLQTPSCCGTP